MNTTLTTALTASLVELIDLSLLAKQAHWTVIGCHFRETHAHLDEIAALASDSADLVAERSVAIGITPDGRASTVAKLSPLPQFDAGAIADTAVAATFTHLLEAITSAFRSRVNAIADIDPLSQDVLVEIARELEKQLWMFRVQVPGVSPIGA